MTAFTSNRNYPYPQDSDRPCDGADALADLALAVDDDMNALWSDVVRLNEVPFCALAAVEDQELTIASNVLTFTLALGDQYGMSNLENDARQIIVPEDYPGVYQCGVWIQLSTPPANSYSYVTCNFGTEQYSQGEQVGPFGTEYLNLWQPIRFDAPGPFDADPIFVEVWWAGPTNTLVVQAAFLWVIWERDQ